MDESLFQGDLVQSNRILYMATEFAKKNLLYLQEAGELQAIRQHTSKRQKLNSYLFFIVIKGSGVLQFDDEEYQLKPGCCAFVDCQKKYSHKSASDDLWTLKWVHFNGSIMEGIYEKYSSFGGQPCFFTEEHNTYITLLNEIFEIARTTSSIRDFRIYDKLTTLLMHILSESQKTERYSTDASSTDAKLRYIQEYIEQHFTEKISLDELEKTFYINKYYLTRIFKQKYGISINNYIIQQRITSAKYQLRFSNKSIEKIGQNCGMSDASYFNRMFKKIEGVSPRDFRKLWVQGSPHKDGQ